MRARHFFAIFLTVGLVEAQELGPGARRQIAALLAEKASRNAAQAKMDSHLVHAASILRGQPVHPDFPAPPGEMEAVRLSAGNLVEIDISGEVTAGLLAEIRAQGGTVVNAFPEYRSVRARVPLPAVERVAARAEVRSIRVADPGHSNSGPDTAGDIGHQADMARATLGFDGSGVKVGVLSDGLNSLAAEQAAGRLPNINIIPGQRGSGDEGTALLEIVYTLAPGATLYYATATGGQAAMASNIQALADAGCKIIIDDWTYFAEGVFQDDIVSRKVNAVAAAGVLYFSDAQNSGSLLKGNGGTWEGDFVDSGQTVSTLSGLVHNFGTGSNVLTSNALVAPTAMGSGFTGDYELKWSDPLGGSGNDYDLFILDSGLTKVLGSSTTVQNGTQNPEEHILASTSIPAGSRVVIVKHTTAAVRALHLDTERGQVSIATTGATFGHNAAAGAFTMAAVDVQVAHGGAFTGGSANPSYRFTSDGPRRMFYNADGTAITPGNLLFGTNGGTVLNKPDFTAADCGQTGVSGYITFCGTSAAAAHGGALGALVVAAMPSITAAQMRAAFTASALDIEGPGWDPNSGAGIIMAPAAVAAVGAAPAISVGGFTNAASYGPKVAPGSIAAVFGTFLLNAPASEAGLPLPTLLSGVSIQDASGRQVPLFYVSATQANVQVPWELAGQSQAMFSATVDSRTGAAQPAALAPFAPGIFTMNAAGQGAVQDLNYRLVDASNPATAGSSIVQIYCTGLGAVGKPQATGAAAPTTSVVNTMATPTVSIGGATASVVFSGLAPGTVGLYQVDAMVPAASSKGSAVPVAITIGGVASNTVTIAVK